MSGGGRTSPIFNILWRLGGFYFGNGSQIVCHDRK